MEKWSYSYWEHLMRIRCAHGFVRLCFIMVALSRSVYPSWTGDWTDIFIAHVIIIIKSEVSAFPIVIIFFRGRVFEMFVTSYSVTYCIYIPEKRGFCSQNSRIRYVLLIVLACLYITSSHYHHCANLSVDIELMKCLPDIFCRVCK